LVDFLTPIAVYSYREDSPPRGGAKGMSPSIGGLLSSIKKKKLRRKVLPQEGKRGAFTTFLVSNFKERGSGKLVLRICS